MNTTMYATKAMQVAQLIVQKTGTYDDQYRRAYGTTLNNAGMNALLGAVEGRSTIGAPMVAAATMGFINPMATPEQHVIIPNGWATPRLRFMLKLHMTDQMGMVSYQYVTGYTEYSDQSMNNRVDPKMLFFINTISQVKTVSHNTPLGRQTYQNLMDCSHVLVNNQYSGITDPAKIYSLMPETLIDDMEVQDLNGTGEEVFNTTTTLVSTPLKANRRNNIAPVYVANMLDGYLQTARSQEYSGASGLLENMRPNVESASYAHDPFLMWLEARRNMRGYGVAMGNSFTLEDLVQLDSNTPNVMKLAEFMQGGFHSAGTAVGWGGSDGITQFAATLAQALPAYMSQFCFSVVHFTATNQTMSGEIEIKVGNVASFNNGMDLSNEVAAFTYRIVHEMLKGMSYGGEMPFMIEVNCDLMGETVLEVSLNGSPLMLYVAPSFCDSLTTPIITTNQDNLHGIASDFNRIMTQIVENDGSNRGMLRDGSSFVV